MKVVYEDSIIKRIQRAVYDADAAGRRISHIEVTVREANELSEYVRRSLWVDPTSREFKHYYPIYSAGETVGQFYGAEIRVGPT